MSRLRVWFYRRFLGIAIDRDETDKARCMRLGRMIERAEKRHRREA